MDTVKPVLNWANVREKKMNENLYIAHKKLPHKTLRVHSAKRIYMFVRRTYFGQFDEL